MKVAEQLTVVGIEIGFPVFALDQHYRHAVLVYGIIDLLPLLDAHIAGKLGHDLHRIEHVVSQRLQERQDERSFGSLLGTNIIFEFDNTLAQELDLIFEIHGSLG